VSWVWAQYWRASYVKQAFTRTACPLRPSTWKLQEACPVAEAVPEHEPVLEPNITSALIGVPRTVTPSQARLAVRYSVAPRAGAASLTETAAVQALRGVMGVGGAGCSGGAWTTGAGGSGSAGGGGSGVGGRGVGVRVGVGGRGVGDGGGGAGGSGGGGGASVGTGVGVAGDGGSTVG